MTKYFGPLALLVSLAIMWPSHATSQLSGGNAASGNFVEDGSDELALRRVTNPQTLNLYNSYTSPTVYSRFTLAFSGNDFYMLRQIAGGGAGGAVFIGPQSADNLYLYTNAIQWTIDSNGELIGAAGNNIFLGGSRLVYSVAVPTIASGFGTSPAIDGAASAFQITIGTGGIATTGTVNFNATFSEAPSCQANNNTTILVAQAAPTTTQVVITSATPFTAGDVIAVTCLGEGA